MVEKVFLVIDYSGFDKYIKYPYLFVSAGVCYRNGYFVYPSFNRPKELFLDSGAFSLINKYGDYPYDYRRYIAFAKRLKPDYIAIMDYPCEPNSKIDLPIKERIDKTIENAIKLMDLAPNLNWVMVIQGWDVNNYLYCLDKIKEHGLLTPLTAIGSVCVRKKLKEVRDIIVTIRRETPKRIKLHCFGLNLRFVRDYTIFNSIYSFDSHAWCIYKGFPKTMQEKLPKLNDWLKIMNDVIKNMKKQKTLFDYSNL